MKNHLANSPCVNFWSSEMNSSPTKSILDELPENHRAALSRESIRTGVSVDQILKSAVMDAAVRLAGGEIDPDPTANCDLRAKKVIRARDRRLGDGRAA